MRAWPEIEIEFGLMAGLAASKSYSAHVGRLEVGAKIPEMYQRWASTDCGWWSVVANFVL